MVYFAVRFNTVDFQYQNISALDEPTATQIGAGASGGLAGALISKIQKTQDTAICWWDIDS
jgi:hypothetical protein